MLAGELAAPGPAHAAFAVLRRQFGDDEGFGADAEMPAGAPPRFVRRSGGTLGEWVSTTLAQERGVVAALPRALWPAAHAVAKTVSNRVVALDTARAVGRNAWWLRALQATPWVEDAAFTLDADTAVYVTAGVEFDVNWVPMESAYSGEVDVDGYEYHSVGGLAAHVRTVHAVDGRRPAAIADARPVQQRLMFELEAGASGVGPGVFAAFAVHDRDNYAMGNELPHAAAPASEVAPTAAPESAGVVGIVTVTQAHAFRLHNLLHTYDAAASDPLLRPCVVGPQIEATIYEATAAIARKLRSLATARTLKLNTAPTNVVFVPRLQESDEGELEATGYGFYDGHRESTKGVPHLVDFNPAYVRRFPPSATAYSADGAYAAGVIALLAHAKAQYADVHRLMLHKVLGRSATGAALAADALPDDFEAELSLEHALRRCHEAGALRGFCALLRAQGESEGEEAAAAFAEAAQDLADLGQHGTDGYGVDRPVFQRVTALIGGLAHADTRLFSLARTEEAAAELQAIADDVLRLRGFHGREGSE